MHFAWDIMFWWFGLYLKTILAMLWWFGQLSLMVCLKGTELLKIVSGDPERVGNLSHFRVSSVKPVGHLSDQYQVKNMKSMSAAECNARVHGCMHLFAENGSRSLVCVTRGRKQYGGRDASSMRHIHVRCSHVAYRTAGNVCCSLLSTWAPFFNSPSLLEIKILILVDFYKKICKVINWFWK